MLGSHFDAGSLGLSAKSTRQLEQMIDDASWLLYPLKLIANVLKTFVYGTLFIIAIFLYLDIWMTTAHDSRANEIKDFASEQTVYRVDFATGKITVASKGSHVVEQEDFAKSFNGCLGTGEQLKNPTWFDHTWLAEKSDTFQAAYIAASHNVAALQYAIYHAKHGEQVYSFHYVCGYGEGVVVPTPVVFIAFLHSTDESVMDSANAQYNWFTGLCITCTQADFSPRNDNIYADILKPQVTENQAAALKALAATGSPEFWIATAHANGITDKDELFASYAAKNQAQLARLLSHPMTPQEDFNREFTAGLILFGLFMLSVLWVGWKIGKHV